MFRTLRARQPDQKFGERPGGLYEGSNSGSQENRWYEKLGHSWYDFFNYAITFSNRGSYYVLDKIKVGGLI